MVYAGLPSDCVDCHQDHYNATTNPIHSAAGFPTDCDSCHQPSDPNWNQASYPHSVWPLVGTHTAQPCTAQARFIDHLPRFQVMHIVSLAR